MRLDCINKPFEDWVKLCPHPIQVNQKITEPRGSKQIVIEVSIDVDKTKPNPEFVSSDQQQFLELKYYELNKKLQQLTQDRFTEDNPLVQRKISKEIHALFDEKFEIEKQLDVLEKNA